MITISKLNSADLDAVDSLMKRHSSTLGFLPKEALRDYIEKGGVLGAKNNGGQLVGYILYAVYADYIRIAQLCVSEAFRERGIARDLIGKLKKTATTQKNIRLRCRRDFPANDMWPKFGFVPLGERPGRSSSGAPLTLWCLMLVQDEQLGLFEAKVSDEALDAVVDAQVFFDFDEPDSDKTKPSKALLSDFLIDSLKLWITDELFIEIDRNEDPKQRAKSRNQAQIYPRVNPLPTVVEEFDTFFREIFPSGTPSQESDIRQLAKAAASGVNIFITRDTRLLKKSTEIFDGTNLQILSPTDLIIQLHEISQKQSYLPDRISGLALSWQRLTSNDLGALSLDSFLDHGEGKSKFKGKLESLLANPNDDWCELLWSRNDVVAIRVLGNNRDGVLTAHLARVARPHDRILFGCFLIADIVTKAVERNLDMVTLEKGSLNSSLMPELREMGFTKCNDSFVRYCFSRCLDRSQTLSAISKSCFDSISEYQSKSDIELEAYCSPLHLGAMDLEYLLVPIRPVYAMSLFDRDQSARDFFGGKINVLLRWDNVYYRKKTHYRMIRPPARILWYVSGEKKEVVAVSHLDAVEIDTPKALLKEFKKFGTLEWKDLYNMCDGDPSKEIMALKFSHTFPFRKPISLGLLRAVFNEAQRSLVLQSPSRVPPSVFRRLFELGFPE